MNKKRLSMVLFAFGFVSTYLVMCYCIPGLRIKLDAEPLEYFVESVKYTFLFKSIISFVIGIVLAILPRLYRK